MSTSTRLIVVLTLVVGAVMGAAGYVLVRKQEESLLAQRRSEVLAHAITLQIALDNDFRAGRVEDAKRLIDRLSANPKIVGVVLYDETGAVTTVSDPLIAGDLGHSPEVEQVLATGATIERIRSMADSDFFAVLMPIEIGPGRRGVFEIIEIMTFVKAEIAKARLNIAVTTLFLFATIFTVVFLVTRRNLVQPIRSLLAGARAIGRGDLDHRVVVPKRNTEFAALANEFNKMADELEAQRRAAAREAEERLSLEREFRHHERLATVGRLAAGVAHEMGAPLNVIDGRAEQLLARPDAAVEMRQRNLTIIRNQTQRIARTVRQLLGLARPYVLNRARADLSSVTAGACDLVEPESTAAGVAIELGARESAIVDVDVDLVQQVLLYVILNAVQAMPDGGSVRVDVIADIDEGMSAVRVSDTGPGIADEHLAHVFDPFFTTKEVGRGTGLGLSVSSRIVEEHGGRIEAANGPAGGAVFTIFIPAIGRGSKGVAANDESAVARR